MPDPHVLYVVTAVVVVGLVAWVVVVLSLPANRALPAALDKQVPQAPGAAGKDRDPVEPG